MGAGERAVRGTAGGAGSQVRAAALLPAVATGPIRTQRARLPLDPAALWRSECIACNPLSEPHLTRRAAHTFEFASASNYSARVYRELRIYRDRGATAGMHYVT